MENLEPHQRLSIITAANDLRYVGGSVLKAGSHPKAWPFAQWGATVAFEARKHLGDAHGEQLDLGWEFAVAEAARHSGKFFEDKSLMFDGVVQAFRDLLDANHLAYFPTDRRGRAFDFLRDDLSMTTSEGEVVLSNISGLFMLGMSPERAADMESWGPHAVTLASGIGRAAALFTGLDIKLLSRHGNHELPAPTWWDGKADKALASSYGGEFSPEVAVALVSIHSAVQSARLWTGTNCCEPCASAALKHRFVVLYQALRSVQLLRDSSIHLGSLAMGYLRELLDDSNAKVVLSQPLRNLRNGWLHLGFGDIATGLGETPNALTPVVVYTGMGWRHSSN